MVSEIERFRAMSTAELRRRRGDTGERTFSSDSMRLSLQVLKERGVWKKRRAPARRSGGKHRKGFGMWKVGW